MQSYIAFISLFGGGQSKAHSISNVNIEKQTQKQIKMKIV